MAVMKAARWYAAGDIRMEEVPVPQPHEGELLVRVERTGICGSDLEEYLEGPVEVRSSPLTLGHEVVGTVVDCPGGGVPAGSVVVPDVVDSCGTCWWCQRHEVGLCSSLTVRGQHVDGGLAEYMVARAHTVVRVPRGLSLDCAAFAEPTAVAVRALRKVGDLTGTVVCVVGAGSIGNLICQVLAGSGAARIIAVEPIARRRQLACELGASAAAAPSDALGSVHHLSDGRGADVVFECTGLPEAGAAALRLSRRGGTVVLVGFRRANLSLSLMDLVIGERHVLGTAAHVWDEDVTAAVALLANGRVNPIPLLTAVVPLQRVVEDGFERMRQDRDTLKLLVAP